MSGGVDSSVACLLLLRAGYDVIGLTMKLLPDETTGGGAPAPCCTAETARDAAAVCFRLGVPHYTINLVKEFESGVVAPFVGDYASGRTPNPCLLCNSLMKFGHLIKKARQIGADYLATGHYARAVRAAPGGGWIENHIALSGESEGGSGTGVGMGRAYLLRGRDASKDQSYALYGLSQDALRHSMFPLGSLTKTEVRAIAHEAGLATADRPESQEICFVSGDSYREFLAQRGVTARPGAIEDTSGKIVGRHLGLSFYTIGQRRGVGAQAGKAAYVVALDTSRNVVVVGDRKEAFSDGCRVADLNLIAADSLSGPVEGTCTVRYRGQEVPAVMTPGADGKDVEVMFTSPLFAVTPGQALVFYQGEMVYGGGIISDALTSN